MGKKLSDGSLIMALQEAQRLYKGSPNMLPQQRFDAVMSISEWDVFTVEQIAQLAGISTSTVYGWGVTKRGYGAGRFNPRSLDTLTFLLLNRVNKRALNTVLLQAAVDEGNSHRTINKLTGISTSTISRKVRHGNSGSDLLGAAPIG